MSAQNITEPIGTQHPVSGCLEVARNQRFCAGAEAAAAEIIALRAECVALKAKLAETDELLKDTWSLCLKFKEGYEELEELRDRLVAWNRDAPLWHDRNQELADIIATAEKLKE